MTAGFQFQMFDDDDDDDYGYSGDSEYDDLDDYSSYEYSDEAEYSSFASYQNDRDYYRFDLVEGAVTAVYEFDDGRWERENIDRDETYELQADGTILKTERERYGLESEVYSDVDADGLYQKTSKLWSPFDNANSLEQDLLNLAGQVSSENSLISRVGYRETYKFVIKNNLVTQVYELDDGVFELERIDANESYVVDGDSVIKTELERHGAEVTRYDDIDGNGLYAKSSHFWKPYSGSELTNSLEGSFEDWYELNGRFDEFKFVHQSREISVKNESLGTFELVSDADRIVFSDAIVAFDFDVGDPGRELVSIISTAFGSDYLDDYYLIGSSLLNQGLNAQSLVDLIQDAKLIEHLLNGDSTDGWINHVHYNVFGEVPSSELLEALVSGIDDGRFSRSEVLLLASELYQVENADSISKLTEVGLVLPISPEVIA